MLIALPFTWIICFFDKQFYIYLFPSVLIFGLTNVPWDQIYSRKTLLLILPILIFGGFVLMFILGESQIQIYYLANSFSYKLPTKVLLGGASDLNPLLHFIKHFPVTVNDFSLLNEFFIDRLFSLGRWINSYNFSFYLKRNLDSTYFKNPTVSSRILIAFLFFVIFLVDILHKAMIRIAKRKI